MSTLRATTISDLAGTGPATLTGQTAAKAWANWNGTGTIAIRQSQNISSLTDNGTGDNTPNFTNAFADVNYAVSGSATLQASAAAPRILAPEGTTTVLTTSCRCRIGDDTGTASDCAMVSFKVTR